MYRRGNPNPSAGGNSGNGGKSSFPKSGAGPQSSSPASSSSPVIPKPASEMYGSPTSETALRPDFNGSSGNPSYAFYRGFNTPNRQSPTTIYNNPSVNSSSGAGGGGIQVPPPRGVTAVGAAAANANASAATANAQGNSYMDPLAKSRGSPTNPASTGSGPPPSATAGLLPFQPPKPRTASLPHNGVYPNASTLAAAASASTGGAARPTSLVEGGVKSQALLKGAPVRAESGLEQLIAKHKLLKRRQPLSELRRLPGTNIIKVGMDGGMLLQRVTQVIRQKDPMAIFTMTTPVFFYDELQNIYDEWNHLRSLVAALPPHPPSLAASPRSVYSNTSPIVSTSTGAAASFGGSSSHGDGVGGAGVLSFHPVLVFDGIPLSPQVDPTHGPHPSPPYEVLLYTGSTPAAAVPANVKDIVAERFRLDCDLEQYFVRRCVEMQESDVFRAPYYAWAQLAAFFAPTNRYISEVCGSLELLAYPGVDRVITRFDVEEGTFDVVEKQDVLNAINKRLQLASSLKRPLPSFTERDLGYWIMADTVRPLYRLNFLSADLDTVLLQLASAEALPNGRGRGYTFSKSFARDDPEQARLMQVNFSLLDAPVFTCEGKVEPLYMVYGIPPFSSLRVARTFGSPLPSALYFCQLSGMVSPYLFAPAAQSVLVDRWPLIDSAAYRQALRSLLTLRVHSCLHILQVANQLQPPTVWYREYMQNRNPRLQNEKWIDIQSPPYIELEEWDIVGEPSLLLAPQLYFFDIMKLVNRSNTTYRNDGSPQQPIYTNIAETTASILLKTMDQLGYFTHFITMPSELPMESQLSVCSEALQFVTCNTLSEHALLLIEMLRTKTLDDAPIYITPTNNNMEDKYPQGARFACRLLSLVPMNINGPWSGPFDPEMAAFGTISRLMARTLRELMEAITILTFCTRRTYMPLSDINDVLQRLPFRMPIEFAAGQVMLYAITHPGITIHELNDVFPQCFSLHYDLSTLFSFWHMAFKTIRTLQREVAVDNDVLIAADALVRQTALQLDSVSFGFMGSSDI